MVDDVERLMYLFEGFSSAHGVFFPERIEGKKQLGKASTIREHVSLSLWQAHVEGSLGLGIVPISEQSECKWAVIDIDDYDLDFKQLLTDIKDYPFVCCQSKSGGAHLFLFIRRWISAKTVREYMRNMVGILGLGSSEIFPKQDRVYPDRGDVGNWLNMPYFGNSRKCIVLKDDNIITLSLNEFINYSLSKSVEKSFFENTEEIKYEDSPIEQGPPCLQVMSLRGWPEHTRNISLFNIGVYAKKAFPSNWKLVLQNFNKKFFSNGLSQREVEDIIKSLDKKEYAYQCYEEPLRSFCNAKLCRTRKFGISVIVGMPIINSVTKISGDVSVWFVDVEGGRLELTTEELYDNRKFVMKCLNDLNILPNRMKPEKWTAFIQGLVDKSIEIKDESMFKRYEIPTYFKQFIIARLSKEPGDLEANRSYYDKNEQEIRFRFDGFINFLKFKKIDMSRAALLMYFKSRGSRNSTLKDKLRRSIRYTAVRLTDDEILSIEQREKEQEVL